MDVVKTIGTRATSRKSVTDVDGLAGKNSECAAYASSCARGRADGPCPWRVPARGYARCRVNTVTSGRTFMRTWNRWPTPRLTYNVRSPGRSKAPAV